MTTTDHRSRACGSPVLPADEPADSSGYDERVAALSAAYHRTIDHVMTTRYGPAWASRGDLPDDAYTTELIFNQWLSDLLDHIDNAATKAPPTQEN
ncbi:hypothetical protein acdb102_22400 [Acidothermaceae bacterium B102]|nr:hypothetical protein acdb102_22400 [Acidothermaceae bacterium B102]